MTEQEFEQISRRFKQTRDLFSQITHTRHLINSLDSEKASMRSIVEEAESADLEGLRQPMREQAVKRLEELEAQWKAL